jgi:hypothetical protein
MVQTTSALSRLPYLVEESNSRGRARSALHPKYQRRMFRLRLFSFKEPIEEAALCIRPLMVEYLDIVDLVLAYGDKASIGREFCVFDRRREAFDRVVFLP